MCLSVNGFLYRMNGASFLLAISGLASVIMLLSLVFYVNGGFVKRSAEAYAVALLRSCEPQRAQRAPRKTVPAS